MRTATTQPETTTSTVDMPFDLRPVTAVCFGWFMVIMDATIVNVALPSLGREFGASVSALQWVVDAYTVVFAGLLLSAGWLGDRLGALATLRAGLVVFALGSAACGFAPSAGSLIAFRAAQGIGAALLVPASLSLLQSNYDDRRARARAIALWGVVGGVAAGCGPLLGGVLTSTLGWRWIFYLSIPAALAGLLTASRWIRSDSPRDHSSRFDVPGQLAGIGALALVTAAFVEAGRSGWSSPGVIVGFCAFALSAALFLILETRTSDPMLPLTVFRRRELSAATAVGLLMNLGFYGQLFVLTLSFQRLRGDSPALTGLALLPQTAVVALGSWLGGLATRHRGPRTPTVTGMTIGAIGFLGLALVGARGSYLALLAPMAAAGLGISVAMPAVTSAAVEGAPQGRAGLASGILNASRQVGAAIGIALLGALIAGRAGFASGLHAAMFVACATYVVAAAIGAFLPAPED